MKKILTYFCTGIVALFTCSERLTAATGVGRVGVSSEADELYAQARQVADGLREESYIFAEGQFFPGESTEPSLRAIKFGQLIKPLAYGLAEQNYFPAPEQAMADLLITVHWGVTSPADFDEAFQDDLVNRTQEALDNQPDDPALIDYGHFNELSAQQDNISLGINQEVMENARLLGYLPAMVKERDRDLTRGVRDSGPTAIAQNMAMERYFIVLMAWDNQLIQTAGERKLQWVVRTNLQALGHRFAESVPAMIRAGSQYYGRHLEAPQTVRTHLGPGRVEIAEPEIIGVEK